VPPVVSMIDFDHCGHKFIKKIELANFFGIFLRYDPKKDIFPANIAPIMTKSATKSNIATVRCLLSGMMIFFDLLYPTVIKMIAISIMIQCSTV